ncbi:MAG: sodium-dependent transporter [Candidatus Accumulibacter sp.]|jgi:NSS family neurotransmitter:Na+ symporter|nr:sodium-dependent transporter [Accumulibacter sp.]
MKTSSSRSSWSSRWAFILVTIGSSVGLGNIWKFPYMTGSHGGSAFVLVYLLCVLLISWPLMMAEILIGRRGRGNPVSAMRSTARECGASSLWVLVGWAGALGALLILSFYGVVAGWIVDYLFKAFSGVRIETVQDAKQSFDALMNDPRQLILWQTLFMVFTVSVVARGVVSGIELANKIMMPGLFIILLCLVFWGALAGDMSAAAHFLFDIRFEAITPKVVLAAVGHAFFSLSIGMGAIMTYGSYLGKESNIATTSVWVAVSDTLIGLLAGLAIFSLTFRHGLAPAEGPGLILQTLPLAFSHMPGGGLFAALFFLLVSFAAWTSAISLLEPFVAWLVENRGVRRSLAAWGTGLAVWLLGMCVCLSFNVWSDFSLFGHTLFDALDGVTSRLLMPLSGIAIGVYVGWVMERKSVEDEMRLGSGAFSAWFAMLRYLAPVGIAFVFIHALNG